MPFDRSSLQALRNLIADTDLILKPLPTFPRTARPALVKTSAPRSFWWTISLASSA